MLLRKINLSGTNDLLVFKEGSTDQRAVWNHVCEGTHCLASSFDLSIRPLLNAHGVVDIHIEDQTPKRQERVVTIEEDGDEILYLPESCTQCVGNFRLEMKLGTRDWSCPNCGTSYGSDK